MDLNYIDEESKFLQPHYIVDFNYPKYYKHQPAIIQTNYLLTISKPLYIINNFALYVCIS